MKKILFVAFLSGIFLGSALAEDFLAKVSKGALSDNSAGVRELTMEEAKQVVGGYYVGYLKAEKNYDGSMELPAVALFSKSELDRIEANLLQGKPLGENGLCGIDILTCSNPNQRRFVDWMHIIQWGINEFLPVYYVRRQIQVSSKGNRFVVFSYRVGAVDGRLRTYKFDSKTSGVFLNNNMLIKEIANKYKEDMEGRLGGYTIR